MLVEGVDNGDDRAKGRDGHWGRGEAMGGAVEPPMTRDMAFQCGGETVVVVWRSIRVYGEEVGV